MSIFKTFVYCLEYDYQIIVECPPGYYGDYCNTLCSYPFYGSLCTQKCTCSPCHHIYGCNSTQHTTGEI